MDASIRLAMRERGIFCGVMLDVAAYEALLAESGGRPNQDGLADYAIATGVSKQFLERLQSAGVSHGCRITAFSSPGGRVMLALTVQVGVSQLRMLLDIESVRTRKMLVSTRASESLRFLFATDRYTECVEYDFALPKTAIEGLLNLPVGKSRATNWLENTADVAHVAAHLLQERGALLVPGHSVPEEVSVTEVVAYEAFSVAETPKHLH
jgi:hypothetical protein